MEAAIERLTALSCIIIGLSHLAAPKAWAEFFTLHRESDAAGIVNGLVHLPLGLLIVSFHQVWTWPGIIVTLLGCAWTIKSTLYFVRPQLARKTLAFVGEERAAQFRIAGFMLILLGLAIGWIALRAQ